MGVAGYLMLLCEMMGAGVLLRMVLPQGFAIDLIWCVCACVCACVCVCVPVCVRVCACACV